MKEVVKKPSENWDDRKENASPQYIIIHYTGTKTAAEAIERFCDAAPSDNIGRISPHYMIDDTAQIIQFVEEDKRAWHAGKSSWKNITDMNSVSIGIEIWNTGHEFNHENFIPDQINALIDLIHDIRSRWNIPNQNILGHSDIAPGRKCDPGEKFPWRKLEISGIGLMPEMEIDQEVESHRLKENPDLFYQALKQYGYSFTDNRTVLLQEFHRHFVPHHVNTAKIEQETCSAIISLLRQAASPNKEV